MINKNLWLAVDQQTREKIAKDFGMRKSEGSIVADGRVMSDGYSNEALMMITEEGLKERLSRTQKTLPKEFMKLWEYYVADMSGEPIKYSNDEKLNDVVNETLEEPKEEEKEPTYKIHRTAEDISKLSEAVNKSTKPKKKMGRPKGSKSKVVKKKK